MTDTKDGYIVRLLKLGISATAGHSGVPYAVVAHVPLWIDFDAPQVRMIESSHRQTQPTVFKSEKEAQEKMDALLDRLKAIKRNNERTGRHAHVAWRRDQAPGLGWTLIPWSPFVQRWRDVGVHGAGRGLACPGAGALSLSRRCRRLDGPARVRAMRGWRTPSASRMPPCKTAGSSRRRRAAM